jgi:8-oxo-dGTP pyrophosphatase MutT (NUDIX family)
MNDLFAFESTATEFIGLLKDYLKKRLPGVNAHLLLAPEARIDDLKKGIIRPDAVNSAVLLLLYPFQNKLYTAVILRNEYDGVHSGQISLPGGKAEEADPDYIHTALRESQEEIGINPSEVEMIGPLSKFYVRPSNYIVYPFVGYMPEKPVFQPDPTEVQRIIEIDIFNELSFDKIVNKTLTFRHNLQVSAPGFEVSGEFLWGATAMIFSELIYVLHEVTADLNKQTPT